jgi:predicted nucleic acid-binding protein
MAVGPYLLDKSALARVDKPAVAAALLPYTGQLATCSTVLLELGWSATSTRHYERMTSDLAWFELLDIDQPVLDAAVRLQHKLVRRGHQRGPGVADLVLAATALAHSAVVLHYDRDFELIAEVEPTFAQRWIVPRGSAD